MPEKEISTRSTPIQFETAQNGFQQPSSKLWFWRASANICLCAAILALLAGFDLTVYAWLTGQSVDASVVVRIGIWLLITFFPLLMLAGHCIDEVEKLERTPQAASENQKPLTAAAYLRF